MVKKIYKKTYGIALCRYNEKKTAEILMIKKRYTYAFFSFVFGYYKKYNNKQIKHLFNNMTLEEKIDILSLNFSILWYRIWLSNPEQNYNFYNIYNNNSGFSEDNNRINIITPKSPESNNTNLKNTEIIEDKDTKEKYSLKSNINKELCGDKFNYNKTSSSVKMMELNTFYYKKKYIFESTFLKDNGKRLKKIIYSSNNACLEWEIPKGGKLQKESELLCACRELEEETNIKTSDYSILYNHDYITCSNIDYNTTYITHYYVGFLKNDTNYKPSINFNNINQIAEVSDIKWHSINDVIKMSNNAQKTENQYNSSGHLVETFNKAIDKFKSVVKSYYYN